MARLNSMRARMTVICILILAPFLLLICKLLILTTVHVSETKDERILQKFAMAAAGMMADEDWQTRLSQFLANPELKKREIAVLVLDPQQRVVWRSRADGPPWPMRSDDGWQIAMAKAPRNLIVMAWPRPEDGRAQAYERWGLGGLSLLVLIAVSAGAWLLVGRTLQPIRLLSQQGAAASTDDLRVRLVAPSRDAEIVDLVNTLNGLLQRLSETAAAKGRFYSAASHELRTPLQALSAHVEVALSRRRTAPEYEAALQEAHKQIGRLTALVRDLLLLHQLDSIPPGPPERIDLGEVCTRVLRQLGPLAEARGLQVRACPGQAVELLSAPTHAEILVRNLVENAIKYARHGGTVTLDVTTPGSGARLEVFDTCDALPEGDPQKLFEPFYRPDAARSARTGGNGLGLAICRAIAAANGWTVTLHKEPDGLRAVVLF